jgi:hypothetical protein
VPLPGTCPSGPTNATSPVAARADVRVSPATDTWGRRLNRFGDIFGVLRSRTAPHHSSPYRRPADRRARPDFPLRAVEDPDIGAFGSVLSSDLDRRPYSVRPAGTGRRQLPPCAGRRYPPTESITSNRVPLTSPPCVDHLVGTRREPGRNTGSGGSTSPAGGWTAAPPCCLPVLACLSGGAGRRYRSACGSDCLIRISLSSSPATRVPTARATGAMHAAATMPQVKGAASDSGRLRCLTRGAAGPDREDVGVRCHGLLRWGKGSTEGGRRWGCGRTGACVRCSGAVHRRDRTPRPSAGHPAVAVRARLLPATVPVPSDPPRRHPPW